MKRKTHIPLLILSATMWLLTSCNQVVIKVESIPENTPSGQPLFITGNFNNWDPGDNRYQLTLAPDSNYYITLPPGFGQVDYKFTRGDWTTVEKGICGEEVSNRSLLTNRVDTATQTIESWNDLDPINCPKLTILIDDIPENTPAEDVIAIASNINSWDPDDASISKKTASGQRYITIDRPSGVSKLEYKLTRGDLSTSESDEFGNQLPNRSVDFGTVDTVKISVKGWADMTEAKPDKVVLILQVPKNTPSQDPVYLANNLNSWTSGDKNYQFQLNKNGQLFYAFPRKNLQIDYKITREGWNTVEVDKNGYDISNRQLDLSKVDTVFLEVARWKDMGRTGDNDITIVLEKLPETTPDKAKIYLSGSFNDWNPGRLRYLFWEDTNGLYYINLPRRNGDFEFRVTRGSWESAQINAEGLDMPPYRFNYNDFDTLYLQVENWKDLPTATNPEKVTLVIDDMPINTPTTSKFYLAPDFNGWDPYDKRLIFSQLPDGRPAITIPVRGNKMEFKITRGGWNKVEVDKSGQEIENRILYLGFSDSIHLDIARWRDKGGDY
jgi:hypothetical protein